MNKVYAIIAFLLPAFASMAADMDLIYSDSPRIFEFVVKSIMAGLGGIAGYGANSMIKHKTWLPGLKDSEKKSENTTKPFDK